MPTIPPAAKPTRHVFDPWNSSSTGHQYAENRMSGSTSWRESRTGKLASQFGDQTRAGGTRMYDSVGAGALGFGKDGRTENGGWDERSVRGARGKLGMKGDDIGKTGDLGAWLRGDKDGLRGGLVKDLKRERDEQEAVIMEREEKRQRKENPCNQALPSLEVRKESDNVSAEHWTADSSRTQDLPEELQRPTTARSAASTRDEYERIKASETPEPAPTSEARHLNRDPLQDPKPTTIFKNCVFYINGSTMPLISDHRLKFLISQHGGLTNIALGRKTVTHVILGTPHGKGGVGGGLAGGKLQKEIEKIRGKDVKFVAVDWLLESVKAGKRLAEAGFASSSISTAPNGVKSVYGLFKQTKPGTVKQIKKDR